MEPVLAILLLAFLTEATVEYFFNVKEAPKDKKPAKSNALKYTAAALGVLLAVAYDVDILRDAGLISTLPIIGNIVSGIIIGRGSNYANDFIGLIRTYKKKA